MFSALYISLLAGFFFRQDHVKSSPGKYPLHFVVYLDQAAEAGFKNNLI